MNQSRIGSSNHNFTPNEAIETAPMRWREWIPIAGAALSTAYVIVWWGW